MSSPASDMSASRTAVMKSFDAVRSSASCAWSRRACGEAACSFSQSARISGSFLRMTSASDVVAAVFRRVFSSLRKDGSQSEGIDYATR
jgi:hypothetical protein